MKILPILIAKELSKALKANNVQAYVSRSITCQDNPPMPIPVIGANRKIIALVDYDGITFDAYNECSDKDQYLYRYIAASPDFDPQQFVNDVVRSIEQRTDIMLFITDDRHTKFCGDKF